MRSRRGHMKCRVATWSNVLSQNGNTWTTVMFLTNLGTTYYIFKAMLWENTTIITENTASSFSCLTLTLDLFTQPQKTAAHSGNKSDFFPQTIQLAAPLVQLRLCAKCVKVTQLKNNSEPWKQAAFLRKKCWLKEVKFSIYGENSGSETVVV